jgi:hypothetical protein
MKQTKLWDYGGKRVVIFTNALKVIGTLHADIGRIDPLGVVEITDASVTSLIDVQTNIAKGIRDWSEKFPLFTIDVDAIQGFGVVD